MKTGDLLKTAGFLMVVNVSARTLGMVRDLVMGNIFGQNYVTDAYNSAFLIPDFIYNILIGGAISAAFIPVFSTYVAENRHKEAWQVASIVVSWTIVLMSIIIGLAFIFTPQIIELIVPGFDEQYTGLTVTLTRIMLLQPLFMTLAGVSQGVLQSYQSFTAPAIGMLFYNVFIVLGGALLAEPIENLFPGLGISGFALGVVIGSFVYFCWQIPALRKAEMHFSFNLNIKHSGFRQLVKLMIPAIIGLSVSRINFLINTILSSSLAEGSLTALRNAQKFMDLPIGVFAVAIAMALFPNMTQQAATNQMDDFKGSISLGIRNTVFVCLPSAVGLIVLSEPIIRLLFEHGNFTAFDTTRTAQALIFYCIGLTFNAIQGILVRSFYALKNTITPLVMSIITISINAIFSLILVGPMGHIGLALAYSLSMIAQCLIYFILLRKKIGQIGFKNMFISFFKTGLACMAMGIIAVITAYGVNQVLGIDGKTEQLLQVGISMALAVIAFFGIAYLLKMEEAKNITAIIKRRFKRTANS